MSSDSEYAAALQEALSGWRMQESITLAFYALYIYYYFTTIDEEVATVFPQKWSWGRVFFTTIRYGTLVYFLLDLTRNYRTYLVFSNEACKGLYMAIDIFYISTCILATDIAIGLCLCALLGAGPIPITLIMIVCSSSPIASLVINLMSDVRIPAEDLSDFEKELGYSCYVPSSEEFIETTGGYGYNIRVYVNFARTALLFILAIAALFFRYKQQKGRLIQVIRRDGGLYYLTVTATRFALAIVNTPAVVPVDKWDGSPAYILFDGFQYGVIPILAQRLLINIRTVDYMGSVPLASTLLFAAQDAGARTDETDSLELSDFSHEQPNVRNELREEASKRV